MFVVLIQMAAEDGDGLRGRASRASTPSAASETAKPASSSVSLNSIRMPASSSTTSTDAGMESDPDVAFEAPDAGNAWAGKIREKVVPRPRPLSTSTQPPWRSMVL
jgi:hypothetical protein